MGTSRSLASANYLTFTITDLAKPIRSENAEIIDCSRLHMELTSYQGVPAAVPSILKSRMTDSEYFNEHFLHHRRRRRNNHSCRLLGTARLNSTLFEPDLDMLTIGDNDEPQYEMQCH
jgi:hypothetical protein